MTFRRPTRSNGFTLIELIVIIVVLGILATVAFPKLFSVTKEAEIATVDTMVSNLESALSIYVARQYTDGGVIATHNPFDDLSNRPQNYVGENDPVNPANTPNGKWSFRPSGNWIIYNPKSSITGGWLSGGERFVVYQVQPVVEGADTVGLRLSTTAAYAYSW